MSHRIAALLRRVADCGDGAAAMKKTRPLRVAGEPLGATLPAAAAELARFPEVFRVTDEAVDVVAGDSVPSRSKAVAGVLQRLREEDTVPMLKGWRNEEWPVKASFHSAPALVVERAAGPLLGVRGYGCHVNGIVESPKGPLLWVATRSRTKPTYPGRLDHIVAGGLSHGELPGDNVIRECFEEARVPKELAQTAQPTGVVSYCQTDETGWGVKRDVIFCYDLILPSDFQPTAGDGEVEAFELMGMDAVIDSLVSGSEPDWKPNVAVVIIDMLVRRGFLRPEEDGYVELVYCYASDDLCLGCRVTNGVTFSAVVATKDTIRTKDYTMPNMRYVAAESIANDRILITLQVDEGAMVWCAAWSADPAFTDSVDAETQIKSQTTNCEDGRGNQCGTFWVYDLDDIEDADSDGVNSRADYDDIYKWKYNQASPSFASWFRV
ncbi:NUDT20 [Symbiodinium natans]|uniref:NUDT20 protein n=1 Tax=Symbiodinium natans TaxID=878477 RepID=A0A812INZ6_9DINO|nr:NUDT20 [Symbiodinium natans]